MKLGTKKPNWQSQQYHSPVATLVMPSYRKLMQSKSEEWSKAESHPVWKRSWEAGPRVAVTPASPGAVRQETRLTQAPAPNHPLWWAVFTSLHWAPSSLSYDFQSGLFFFFKCIKTNNQPNKNNWHNRITTVGDWTHPNCPSADEMIKCDLKQVS